MSAVVFIARRRVSSGSSNLKLLFIIIIMSQFLEGFNSHHDSVKPLFHSPLLDRLKRHLELACSRSASDLSFKLILYPNSDSTSQLTRLTTSGDISLNSGPERCSVCGNSVARNHRSHHATPANFGATSSAVKSHQGSLKGFNHSKKIN